MSVIFTFVEDGTVPLLDDVNEPSTMLGGVASGLTPSEHVDGTAVLSTLPTPAIDTPTSKVVAAGRPVPVMATDPPTSATVGVAVRLAPSVKTLSPHWPSASEPTKLLDGSGFAATAPVNGAMIVTGGPGISVATGDTVEDATAFQKTMVPDAVSSPMIWSPLDPVGTVNCAPGAGMFPLAVDVKLASVV